MARREISGTAHPQRDQTDESLRVEREKADASAERTRDAEEGHADDVVRLARQRADEVVQSARDDADDASGSQSAATSQKRDRADVVLERERAHADAVLGEERLARRRYLTDFLEVERDTTDRHLDGERDHADTVVAARDDFLAIVSHDLRSLLGGLAVNATMAARSAPEGPDGDNVRTYIGRSERLIQRIDRLVSDLLDVASMEAGALSIERQPVAIATLLAETRAAFAPIAAAREITLTVDDAPAELLASCDSGRVLQVLANLVSNALKFTAAGGRVEVRLVESADTIELTVSDTGVGIPGDQLDSVFEAFHQVTRDRRGLGLGLHIARGIVAAHGGRMWAASELGVGSRFHVALPRSA